MIRLWIISLDYCFLLLHWLDAIHLPPPPESQPLLNCLSPSVLFPLLPPTLPAPVTPRDPHLSPFAAQHLLRSKMSCSQSKLGVFIGHLGLRKSLSLFSNPPALTFTSADSQVTNLSRYL